MRLDGVSMLKVRLKQGIAACAQIVPRGWQQPGARCLVYHSIVAEPQRDPAQMTTPVALFREQMDVLADQGYQVIDATQMLNRLRTQQVLDPKTVVLTFDDGLADNYRLALPILSRVGFRATVFLIAGALEGSGGKVYNGYDAEYLSWAQIRELKASGLIRFGCHSATHQSLRDASAPVLGEEIREAKRRLEDGLGEAVELFAYPFGSFGTWDRGVRDAVERAGFLGAFTSVAGFNPVSRDPFLLRRSRVSWCDEVPEFERILAGAYDWYALLQRCQTPWVTRRRAPCVAQEELVVAHGRN